MHLIDIKYVIWNIIQRNFSRLSNGGAKLVKKIHIDAEIQCKNYGWDIPPLFAFFKLLTMASLKPI